MAWVPLSIRYWRHPARTTISRCGWRPRENLWTVLFAPAALATSGRSPQTSGCRPQTLPGSWDTVLAHAPPSSAGAARLRHHHRSAMYHPGPSPRRECANPCGRRIPFDSTHLRQSVGVPCPPCGSSVRRRRPIPPGRGIPCEQIRRRGRAWTGHDVAACSAGQHAEGIAYPVDAVIRLI
jgi:hypothetical protein